MNHITSLYYSASQISESFKSSFSSMSSSSSSILAILSGEEGS
jgi:hypothetical protein